MRNVLAAVAAASVLVPVGAVRAQASHEAHAMPDVPATVAEWAAGARLYDGLGIFHRAVTTSAPDAQQYFDQGMRLLWAFNHDEATRSFAKAAALDPACAACYWGVALTVGPNYNLRSVPEVRAQVAGEALHKAQVNASRASAVEQALIGALAARYPPSAAPAVAQADAAAYAQAMTSVADRFPDDLDVQTLCAEAQMNVRAWHLWSADGQPAVGTPEIRARLESVLRRDPTHPGANHYYIHVMEASAHPEKAVASAERLRDMMPGAGHMVHMPAHILQRIGRYEEAAEANRRAVAADLAYLESATAPDYYPMYLAHNYSFLASSAAMEGRKAETLGAIQGVGASTSVDMLFAMGDSGWMLAQQYGALVRFGLWDELLALQPPDPRLRGATAGYLFGRGVALAARGRLEEAQQSLAELEQLRAALPADLRAHKNTLSDVVAVAVPIVAARIAASAQHQTDAVALLEQAVTAEDKLAYAEPEDWFVPARHLLGAQLLIAGRPAQAERVYREDLRRNPANGWALYGLAAAVREQGRAHEATGITREFEAAWRHADVRLLASAFWFAGPDTLSCECQRASLSRPAGGS